jgi:hypothetical protein
MERTYACRSCTVSRARGARLQRVLELAMVSTLLGVPSMCVTNFMAEYDGTLWFRRCCRSPRAVRRAPTTTLSSVLHAAVRIRSNHTPL